MLVGKWDTELSNAAFLPKPTSTVHGEVSFEWLEGREFLLMRQGSRAAGPPYASWIIGRDESALDFTVLYSDDRGVSRVYSMSFRANLWKLWRQSPGFSQRFEGRVIDGGQSIIAQWEKSADGRKWEHDFDMTYRKRT